VTAFENCWVEIGVQVVFNSAGYRLVLFRLNWACYCVGHHGSSSPQVAVALRTCPSHRCRLCIVSHYYDQRRCARCPTFSQPFCRRSYGVPTATGRQQQQQQQQRGRRRKQASACASSDNCRGVGIGNGSRGNNLGRLLRSMHRGATCWLRIGAVRT